MIDITVNGPKFSEDERKALYVCINQGRATVYIIALCKFKDAWEKTLFMSSKEYGVYNGELNQTTTASVFKEFDNRVQGDETFYVIDTQQVSADEIEGIDYKDFLTYEDMVWTMSEYDVVRYIPRDFKSEN